jgi:hypothetical protein
VQIITFCIYLHKYLHFKVPIFDEAFFHQLLSSCHTSSLVCLSTCFQRHGVFRGVTGRTGIKRETTVIDEFNDWRDTSTLSSWHFPHFAKKRCGLSFYIITSRETMKIAKRKKREKRFTMQCENEKDMNNSVYGVLPPRT